MAQDRGARRIVVGIAENPQLYDEAGKLRKNWRSLPHARNHRLPRETVEAVKLLAAQGLGLWAIHRTLEDQGILVSKQSVWNITHQRGAYATVNDTI